MLSRLFGTENNGVEPPVISGVNGMDLNHIGMKPSKLPDHERPGASVGYV